MVMVRALAVVVPAWKVPTTVEEACDTKPAPKVERPDVVSVLRESDPAVRVPIEALLAFRSVEVAVPKYPVPVTVSTVDDAPPLKSARPPKVERPVLLKLSD